MQQFISIFVVVLQFGDDLLGHVGDRLPVVVVFLLGLVVAGVHAMILV